MVAPNSDKVVEKVQVFSLRLLVYQIFYNLLKKGIFSHGIYLFSRCNGSLFSYRSQSPHAP